MRRTLLIVETPANWPLTIPNVEVVAARNYLSTPEFSHLRRAIIFNLCRSYRYQSVGYYVSLLAEARGHKCLPTVTTIQDMKSLALFRTVADDLDALIQQSLAPIRSDHFLLSVYFGRNVARRYDRLSSRLFRLFDVPLFQVQFARVEEEWVVRGMSAVAINDIPEAHRDFVIESAEEYLTRPRPSVPQKVAPRYDLAILWDPKQATSASNEKAIKRFVKAGESLGLATEIIDRSEYGRIAEFDALFIRDTTAVHHYTYRFSRRAAAEGLVVIDDPVSILRCTNKVYLAELLARHRMRIPKTLVVNRSNLESIRQQIDLPCILKQPDSSFSQGVIRVETVEEFREGVASLLERSELIIAQEFLPTAFDWRVGILDREAIYACRYHMARRHWQIIRQTSQGRSEYGRVETLPIEETPPDVIQTALRAANLVGDGFYGVDLKEIGGRCYVIEINDNPSVDAGYEDSVLEDQLYLRIISVFLRRLDGLRLERNGQHS